MPAGSNYNGFRDVTSLCIMLDECIGQLQVVTKKVYHNVGIWFVVIVQVD